MKLLHNTVLPMLLCAVWAAAAPYNSRNGNNENGSNLFPVDSAPETANMNSTLRQNRFEINIDEGMAKTVGSKRIRYQKIMSGTLDINLLQKPLLKPFTTVDSLHLSSTFLSTIVFPERFRVVYAKPSVKMKVAQASQNLVLLQPEEDFINGNIFVSLTDGAKNYFATIMLDIYNPEAVVHDANEGRYLYENDYLSTVVRYIDMPKVSGLDVFKSYTKMHGEKQLLRKFATNGDFDVMTLSGVPFYIVRDDKDGTIDYQGKSFSVTNNYIRVRQ